jgi:hypothetical protein
MGFSSFARPEPVERRAALLMVRQAHRQRDIPRQRLVLDDPDVLDEDEEEDDFDEEGGGEEGDDEDDDEEDEEDEETWQVAGPVL